VADAAAGADGFEESLGAEAHFGFGEAGEVEGEKGVRWHDTSQRTPKDQLPERSVKSRPRFFISSRPQEPRVW
jgi:hypothetical protein